MANQIRLKRASGSNPGASDLVTGEVAIRTDTGKIFTKKDDNSVVEVGVGISDVVDDTSPQLGGTLDTNGNLITFGDSTGVSSNRLKFGAGPDLQISHNGTNSIIQDSGTGGLFLLTDNLVVKNANSNETILTGTQDGAVELYFDNSKKFETWTSGARLPSDNNVLAIGAGDDLRLWHNATNSIIRNLTGQLQIQSNDLRLGNYNFTETYLKALENGAVELYHDNSKKFETASYGGSITGNLGIGVSGTPQDVLDLGNASGGRGIAWGGSSGGNGHYATIYTEYSSASLILGAGVKGSTSSTDFIAPYTGSLGNSIIEMQAFGDEGMIFYVDADASRTAGDTITPTERLRINTSGDVKVPDNGKFVCGASNDLQIYHDGSNSFIDEAGTGGLKIRVAGTGDNGFYKYASDEKLGIFIPDGAVELYHNNSKKFETTSDGVKIKNTITMEEASGSEAYQFSVNSFGGLDINNETTKIAEFTDSSTFNLLDNVKITCGTGSDLEIYHNGNHSIIDNSNGTGDLKLIGDDVIIQAGNDETMAKFIENGAVELYHNNTKKFETSSSGVSISGDVLPNANNSRDLGSSSLRWQNLFVNDMHFANSVDNPNKVDGTWGDWTLQEGEDTIYMLNNRNGKQYKMNLTEV